MARHNHDAPAPPTVNWSIAIGGIHPGALISNVFYKSLLFSQMDPSSSLPLPNNTESASPTVLI